MSIDKSKEKLVKTDIKKQKRVLLLAMILLIVFVAISIVTFYESNRIITKGYLSSEGNAAENFAVLTAANIHLTDAQVDKLKNCSYAELQSSEENTNLKDMMSNTNFKNKVDYAYIMVHLKDDEVKYKVTEEDASRFDAPVGTKLDIMWLLDVNVSEENINSDDSDELTRYSYYIDDDALIFGEAPTYVFNSSEWGDHICGYSPIYTEEGTYIGVVGVELQTEDYNSYAGIAMLALGILLAVSTFFLAAFFVILYRRYQRIQFEKIYTDPLTKISNRSFYNDRFIKRMNAKSVVGTHFALMIMDIDFFKKINDTFGHDIGDEVLIELGEILLDVFGKENVVRFGGEEFVAGVWIDSEAELNSIIQKLYDRIAAHKFSKCQIQVHISLGCSYYKVKELHGWLMSGMLRAADCKLYEAKEGGRNRFIVIPYDENVEYKKADK